MSLVQAGNDFFSSTESIDRLCDNVEATISPSALSHRFVSVDTQDEKLLSYAPSPPLEQNNYPEHCLDIEHPHEMKCVKRQIECLKKQMREFEKKFHRQHGYRPSRQDKMNSLFAGSIVIQIDELKKHLLECKQKHSPCFRCEHSVSTDSSCTDGETSPALHDHMIDLVLGECESQSKCSLNTADESCCSEKIESQVEKVNKTMAKRRFDTNRPQDITLMTAGQIVDEMMDLHEQMKLITVTHQCEIYFKVTKCLYDRLSLVKSLVKRMPCAKNYLHPERRGICSEKVNSKSMIDDRIDMDCCRDMINGTTDRVDKVEASVMERSILQPCHVHDDKETDEPHGKSDRCKCTGQSAVSCGTLDVAHISFTECKTAVHQTCRPETSRPHPSESSSVHGEEIIASHWMRRIS